MSFDSHSTENPKMRADSRAIVVSYDLPFPPAKVWRALTEPELVAAWLMVNDIKPVVGHRFTFKASPMPGWDGVVHCEVLAADEPKLLRYSWQGGAETSRLNTTVTWTLTPTASGTHLGLEHDGFLPINGFAFDAMSKGWQGKVADRISATIAGL